MDKNDAIDCLRALTIGNPLSALERGRYTPKTVRDALNVAIECMEASLVLVQPPVLGEDDARLRLVRVMNLLGDIVKEATEKPDRLTSFNSPLLQLACMEIYGYFNPDEPVDEKSKEIFRQMAMVGYNV